MWENVETGGLSSALNTAFTVIVVETGMTQRARFRSIAMIAILYMHAQ
jgi:hypothetical protein